MNKSIRPLRKGKFRHPDDVEKELGGEVEAVEELDHGLPPDVDPAILEGLDELEKAIVIAVANSQYQGTPRTMENDFFMFYDHSGGPFDTDHLVGTCYRLLRTNPQMNVDGVTLDDLDLFGNPDREEFLRPYEKKEVTPKGACFKKFEERCSEYLVRLATEPARLILHDNSPVDDLSLVEHEGSILVYSITLHQRYIKGVGDADMGDALTSLLRMADHCYREGFDTDLLGLDPKDHAYDQVLVVMEALTARGYKIDEEDIRNHQYASLTEQLVEQCDELSFDKMGKILRTIERWYPNRVEEAIELIKKDKDFVEQQLQVLKPGLIEPDEKYLLEKLGL